MLVVFLGVLCHGDLTEKLKLLYKMHVIPGECAATRFIVFRELQNKLMEQLDYRKEVAKCGGGKKAFELVVSLHQTNHFLEMNLFS